eukprot:1166932-Alexandrium_andersonii.AAC.1
MMLPAPCGGSLVLPPRGCAMPWTRGPLLAGLPARGRIPSARVPSPLPPARGLGFPFSALFYGRLLRPSFSLASESPGAG